MDRQREGDVVRRRIDELEPGDATIDYGPVAHREGRKVWFADRIVTFPSPADEIEVRAMSQSRR